MPQTSETPHNGGASRNSCGGQFQDALSLSPFALQLPPIIGLHLWRPDELAVIETATMLAFMLIGGTHHG